MRLEEPYFLSGLASVFPDIGVKNSLGVAKFKKRSWDEPVLVGGSIDTSEISAHYSINLQQIRRILQEMVQMPVGIIKSPA